MMKKTSYSIHSTMIRKIERVQKKWNESKSNIVKNAIEYYCQITNKSIVVSNATITYQPKIGNYKKMNVFWTFDEYNFILYIKNMFRSSISYLIDDALYSYFKHEDENKKKFVKKVDLKLKSKNKVLSRNVMKNYKVRWWLDNCDELLI